MMREKETNKFRGVIKEIHLSVGMAFVDIPDGSTWKALNLHKTYFNGRLINVEETKDGGKHSAVKKHTICQHIEKEGFHYANAKSPQQAKSRTKRTCLLRPL